MPGERPRIGHVGRLWGGFKERFQLWRRRRATRCHLADLSDAALRDIGLTRREAEAEMRRSMLLPVDHPVQPPF